MTDNGSNDLLAYGAQETPRLVAGPNDSDPYRHSVCPRNCTADRNVVRPDALGTRQSGSLTGTKANLLGDRHYGRIHAQIFWAILLVLIQFCALQKSVIAADFSGANLSGAHLTNADLRAANLKDANLTDANLSRTDLTGANVTQQQLDTACGTGTRLPAGLTIRPCPASETKTHGIERPITNDHAPLKASSAISLLVSIRHQGPSAGIQKQVFPQSPEHATVPPNPAVGASFKAAHQ